MTNMLVGKFEQSNAMQVGKLDEWNGIVGGRVYAQNTNQVCATDEIGSILVDYNNEVATMLVG